MDWLSDVASAVTVVGGVYGFYRYCLGKWRGRPSISAEERPIVFNHDRKDQLLVRLEFRPGARSAAFKSIRARGCQVALTRWGGPSEEVQADKTPLDNFAAYQSIDWRIPDNSETQEPLVTYVCVKSPAGWIKDPERKRADVAVSRGLFGRLRLQISSGTKVK